MLLTTRLAKALQLTLAVIKPDGVAHPLMLEGDFYQSQGSVSVVAPHIPPCIRYAKALHQKILDNSFAIVRCKDLVWRRQDSEKFYIEHAGRFFYQRLVEFMSSGPMRAYVLAREDAVSHWRELMGPTKVFQARHTSPATIRAQYGLTDTRNTTHGSDSSESARREILYFFPEFGMEEWMEKEEPAFRAGRIKYDERRQIHALPTQS